MSSWGITVDVDAFDLHSEGWHHTSECDSEVTEHRVADESVIRVFHDIEHEGAFRWCSHPVCDMMQDRETAE